MMSGPLKYLLKEQRRRKEESKSIERGNFPWFSNNFSMKKKIIIDIYLWPTTQKQPLSFCLTNCITPTETSVNCLSPSECPQPLRITFYLSETVSLTYFECVFSFIKLY